MADFKLGAVKAGRSLEGTEAPAVRRRLEQRRWRQAMAEDLEK